MKINKGIILVIICTLLTAAGQILWKIGMSNFELATIYLNWPVIAGLGLYVFGAILLTFALRYSDLSKIHPFLSLGYVWVFFIGIFYLGEVFTAFKLIGISLIIVGVIFIGRSR